jgi:acyl-phosphate glycerol 3-phosphate acyltransferase
MLVLVAVGLVLVVSYLVGSVPFGYLIARWRGVDIFKQGSGNIGATNIGRVLGRRFGILVFVLDFAKGAVPVLAARLVQEPLASDLPADGLPVAAGLAAFLGHLFPVYLRFRGGKGVATGAGVVTVLLPGPTLGAVLVWIAVLAATRYVSLASLCAATALCALRLVRTAAEGPFGENQRILTLFCFVAAGLVFLRHRANLGRLAHGAENRLRDSPAMLLFTKILHVLALGLWFGSTVFFTFVVAPATFKTFESYGQMPAAERPAWLPVPPDFDKEKGTRLAGVAVGPIFPWYFLIQGACGLLAVATAFSWFRVQPYGSIHQLRCLFVGLALVTVFAGWPLVDKVDALRLDRYSLDPVVAAGAKAAFGTYHLISLMLNFGTVILVTAAMVLAAWLPSPPAPRPVPPPQPPAVRAPAVAATADADMTLPDYRPSS